MIPQINTTEKIEIDLVDVDGEVVTIQWSTKNEEGEFEMTLDELRDFIINNDLNDYICDYSNLGDHAQMSGEMNIDEYMSDNANLRYAAGLMINANRSTEFDKIQASINRLLKVA